MAVKYSESVLRDLQNVADETYSGKKENYDITPALDTHKSLTKAVEDLATFLAQAKAEMKRLMGQVEDARVEMNAGNAALLTILQLMPEGTQRRDAPGVRTWADTK